MTAADIIRMSDKLILSLKHFRARASTPHDRGSAPLPPELWRKSAPWLQIELFVNHAMAMCKVMLAGHGRHFPPSREIFAQ
jgi:hypothetical protein